MCRRVTCEKCGRPTWAGCGLHIEQALMGVPAESRCKCREAVAVGTPPPPPPRRARPKWWPFG
jgi:hypothetical protein